MATYFTTTGENHEALSSNVSQHEALIQDERIWFPVTGWHQTHLIAHSAFEARPRNFSAEEKHFVENLLLFTGPDEQIAALTQRFCGRNILPGGNIVYNGRGKGRVE